MEKSGASGWVKTICKERENRELGSSKYILAHPEHRISGQLKNNSALRTKLRLPHIQRRKEKIASKESLKVLRM